MLRSTIELYDKMNSANSLLVALGFLEEMLVLFWRRQFPGEDIPNGRPHDPAWAARAILAGPRRSGHPDVSNIRARPARL